MKLQKFIFYRYNFQEDPDSIPEKRVAIEEVGMHFGNLFHVGEKLTMYMKKGKADVSLRNDTFAVHKDIIVFRINDDKDLKRTLPTGTKTNEVDDYNETIEQSFPHCLIILFNQPGMHYVAIEKKAGAFYGNMDKITKILKQNFDRMIKHLGYIINIEPIFMKAKAWDVVKRKCNENNDYVKQISLIAIRDKEKNSFPDFSHNRNIKGFIKDAEDNEAIRAFAGVVYGKDASEQSIKNTIDNMFQINQFIKNNECEIKVKLSKNGIIYLNEEVVPMYFLPERAIENFQIGSSISETEDVSTLEEWLNNCINDIKRTTDATTPPQKLTRPRQ